MIKKANKIKKAKKTKNDYSSHGSNVHVEKADLLIEKQDKVRIVPLAKEVQLSYMDYAMSVIVSRALPDIRDGLKPVQRRILYMMYEMGLRHTTKYRKSAAVVGSCLAKFHPHGDQSVYDTLVRMAQSFSLRYPLVDGHGNFGSIDGDKAAAYRYTEARLTSIAEEMLADIEKDTVNFSPNYDGTTKEPIVLPSRIPNLLLNGSMGIAVGMATNMPPHNLGEICDALIWLIDHPKAEIDDLFKFVKGPDFPTGGFIFDKRQIKQVYALGKGPITMRAKTEIQEEKKGLFQIIISELPYQTNKSTLLQRIVRLIKDKKLMDIRDVRDESTKEGVRIVVELKRNAYPQKILNRLFQSTELQQNFCVNIVTLLNGVQPQLVPFKKLLSSFIQHRQEIVRRRTSYNLFKTRERIHILKGLSIAIKYIDKIIRLIKSSQNREQAKVKLMKNYKLSDVQAQAVLEMRLHQLANLERIKIEDELKEKLNLSKKLVEILSKPKMILKIIKKDFSELKEKYGDMRRTKVISQPITEFREEDLIPDEATLVIVTKDAYIKRMNPENFKIQARGGKGVTGFNTKEEDITNILISTTTHTNLLFFTSQGKVFKLKTYEIPETRRQGRGQSLVNFLDMGTQERISAILPVSQLKNYQWLIMATKNGLIKKVSIKSFENVRRSGLLAIKLKKDDELKWVKLATNKDEIVLITANGLAIRFKENNLRSMGRAAKGVLGIRLKKDDVVVGMGMIKAENKKSKINGGRKILTVSEKGLGKMTFIKKYRLQHRGGRGIKTAKITDKTGKIVSVLIIDEQNLPSFVKGGLLLVSQSGQTIHLAFKAVPTMSRSTQGVRLMRFKNKKDKVASVTLI